MWTKSKATLAGFAALMLIGTPALADQTKEILTVSAGKIRFDTQTPIPNGYYEMCANKPSLCRLHSGRQGSEADGSISLTSRSMEQLRAVNESVNASIRPVHRTGWAVGRNVGDCKDFALSKRQRLISSGWPSSALPVAIVRTFSGEQHLVLVARTNQGDFVLDNLSQSIVPWNSTSYTWEKIQSPTNAWVWYKI